MFKYSFQDQKGFQGISTPKRSDFRGDMDMAKNCIFNAYQDKVTTFQERSSYLKA